jgi:hypothetical protein
LSDWTSYTLSNCATVSPSLTKTLITSTSAMPSPMSASLNGTTPSRGRLEVNARAALRRTAARPSATRVR